MTATWIVTMDDASARLISRHGPMLELVEQLDQRFVTPDALQTPRDAFVHVVGERLERGKQDGEFDKLVLVAGTPWLQMLRDTLDEETANAVYDSLSQDVRELRVDELLPHVWHHLPRC